MKENEDYQLVPLDQDQWGVRLLTGPFIETVVTFGAVGINNELGQLEYNFTIESSPDTSLEASNLELQMHCSAILEAIILDGLDDGTITLGEEETTDAN